MDRVTFDIKEIGDITDGKKYNVVLRVPMDLGWIENARIVFENDKLRQAFSLKHLRNENDFVYFTGEFELNTSAIYHYYFSFEANGEFMYYKKQKITSHQSITDEEKWKMSVNFNVPDWAKGKIMYHIFPDRFYRGSEKPLEPMPRRTIHASWDEEPIIGPDSNGVWNADFYGGDLDGVIQKLDYLKSLGVTIIYYGPCMYSQSNHRYDTSDYNQIDPYVGDEKTFRKLMNEIHKRGMKFILDGVFNHTGNDSRYFNEFGTFDELGAFQSRDSKYFDFYRKYVTDNQVYFDYWWGMTNLPVCDGNSKAWQDFIYGEGGVIDHWFDMGIDGLRLDVADELTDEFIEGITRAAKRNKPDALIIGEVWKNPMRMNRGYISSGKGMHTVMNYPLVDALIKYFKYADCYAIKEIIHEIKTEYPKETMLSLMNFTSTHDISRAMNIFGCDEFSHFREWSWDLNNDDKNFAKNYRLTDEQYQRGKQIYKGYSFTLTFFPGILSIFYGDEVGLQGLGNLANRKPLPWNRVDYDLVQHFQYLGYIRGFEKYLECADIEPLEINDHYMMFERVNGPSEGLTVVNRSDEDVNPFLPHKYQGTTKVYTLGNSTAKKIAPHGGIHLKN